MKVYYAGKGDWCSQLVSSALITAQDSSHEYLSKQRLVFAWLFTSFDQAEVVQGITFRLCDSLPQEAVERMRVTAELDDDSRKRSRAEVFMNAGHGACYLRLPQIATNVEGALLHFDRERYRLLAWVIMPNHVHVLAVQLTGFPLANVIHSWKSFTAKEANRALGRTGAFWAREYYDRYIRNREHLARAIDYIHYNPVKAVLVAAPEEWMFSSARLKMN